MKTWTGIIVAMVVCLLTIGNSHAQDSLEVLQLRASPVAPVGPPCVTTYEGGKSEGTPHYLPEKNPFVDEMTRKFGVPREAVLGTPETLYPEYRKKLKLR